jgi:hypothetical protein
MRGAIAFFSTHIYALWYADWKGAYAARGWLGYLTEAFNCMFPIPLNVWPIMVPKKECSAADVRRMVRTAAAQRHQRPPHVFAFYIFGDELVFCTTMRQATWVIDILKRNRIPLLHRSELVPKYGHRSAKFQNALNRLRTTKRRRKKGRRFMSNQ